MLPDGIVKAVDVMGNGLCQIVVFKGHETDDGARRRRISKAAFGLFRPPTPRCPFSDNTETSAKPSQPKLPP